MATELTAQEILDIHADLGTNSTLFDDTAIQRFYERVQTDYATRSTADHLKLVRRYVLRALKAQAAKLHDYGIAQGYEYLSQVWDHINALDGELKAEIGGVDPCELWAAPWCHPGSGGHCELQHQRLPGQ